MLHFYKLIIKLKWYHADKSRHMCVQESNCGNMYLNYIELGCTDMLRYKNIS